MRTVDCTDERHDACAGLVAVARDGVPFAEATMEACSCDCHALPITRWTLAKTDGITETEIATGATLGGLVPGQRYILHVMHGREDIHVVAGDPHQRETIIDLAPRFQAPRYALAEAVEQGEDRAWPGIYDTERGLFAAFAEIDSARRVLRSWRDGLPLDDYLWTRPVWARRIAE